jgi:hypothetical protein
MSDSKAVNLTTEEQRRVFRDLETAVAADTDREYLTEGEVLRAAGLAYLGRDGWDDVGKDDGRGRSVRAERLAPGGDLGTD